MRPPTSIRFDVILTALPAGTLSGAPKVRAMQIIDELEDGKARRRLWRGRRATSPLTAVWDTCIVLRTALVKDGMMYVQAGGRRGGGFQPGRRV